MKSFVSRQVVRLQDECETLSNKVWAQSADIVSLRAEVAELRAKEPERIVCPSCGARVTLTPTGNLRSHRREDEGVRCVMSGLPKPRIGGAA